MGERRYRKPPVNNFFYLTSPPLSPSPLRRGVRGWVVNGKRTSPKYLINQALFIHLEIIGNLIDDAAQSAYPQGFVMRNGDVVLGAFIVGG
jgi:hypothetical protein